MSKVRTIRTIAACVLAGLALVGVGASIPGSDQGAQRVRAVDAHWGSVTDGGLRIVSPTNP